jgi:hypothetical protein
MSSISTQSNPQSATFSDAAVVAATTAATTAQESQIPSEPSSTQNSAPDADGFEKSNIEKQSTNLVQMNMAAPVAGPKRLSAEELQTLKDEWADLDPETRRSALKENGYAADTNVGKLTVKEFKEVLATGKELQAETDELKAEAQKVKDQAEANIAARKKEKVAELNKEIAKLEKERDQMLAVGQDASDTTCGTAQLFSEGDTVGDKIKKVINNMTPVDPYECAGGDQWRRTMEHRAGEKQKEIDALVEERDAL